MRNIRNWKQTCQTLPHQDEWWDLESGFFTSFVADEWSIMRQKQLPFFFFIYLSLSTPLMRFPAALGPACMNVDRDRHTQGGQQPCLASACSPWQKISMRADNRTRNENNAVCQPRNPACHSRTFAILGVFHEQSSTRKLNFKFNSSFSALIPELRPRKSCSSFASMTATPLCVFSPAIFLQSLVRVRLCSFLTPNNWYISILRFLPFFFSKILFFFSLSQGFSWISAVISTVFVSNLFFLMKTIHANLFFSLHEEENS